MGTAELVTSVGVLTVEWEYRHEPNIPYSISNQSGETYEKLLTPVEIGDVMVVEVLDHAIQLLVQDKDVKVDGIIAHDRDDLMFITYSRLNGYDKYFNEY